MEDFDYNKTYEAFLEGEKLIKSEEYKIEKDNNSINILIGRTDNYIIIRNLFNEIKLTLNDLTILTNIVFNSIDESYEYIKEYFDEKKVSIKESGKRNLKLLILIYDPIKKKDKEIEISLKSKLKTEMILSLIEKYIKLENKLNDIQKENEELKKENNKIKSKINEIIPDIEMFKEIFGLNEQQCNNNQNNQVHNNQMNNNQVQNNQMNNNQNYNFQQMRQMFGMMRMNNQMNQMPQMNNNLQNNMNNINIFFRNKNQGVIVVNCLPNESVNDLIIRYRTLSGDNNSTRFIYNGTQLFLMYPIGFYKIRDNSFIDVE